MDLIAMLQQQQKILVITGPPASGKSLLAKQLAEKHGTWSCFEPYDMKSNHRFKKYLNGYDVIIVDGITPYCLKDIPADTIIASASREYVLKPEKMKNKAEVVEMPFMILVTQEKHDVVRYVSGDPWERSLERRLHIIDLV